MGEVITQESTVLHGEVPFAGAPQRWPLVPSSDTEWMLWAPLPPFVRHTNSMELPVRLYVLEDDLATPKKWVILKT